MVFMVRPYHIPGMTKIHAWDHVNKQGDQVSNGNNAICLTNNYYSLVKDTFHSVREVMPFIWHYHQCGQSACAGSRHCPLLANTHVIAGSSCSAREIQIREHHYNMGLATVFCGMFCWKTVAWRHVTFWHVHSSLQYRPHHPCHSFRIWEDS